MPDVEANQQQWGEHYPWPDSGDEWSAGWGGTEAEWGFTLLPRVGQYLPATSILEIAPGYGRWTQYLVRSCDRYVGVDLSASGVAACRERFASLDHAEFHVNDGRSLPMVADDSVDFAFSFDSLVHVEADVIESYLQALARVLNADGVAFIHHSNLAESRPVARPLRSALALAERLTSKSTPGFDHWRGSSVGASAFRAQAGGAGLSCIGQEVVNWLGGRLIDCISVVTPEGSKWDRPNVVVHNPHFMAEAASSARAARVHSRTGVATWTGDEPSQHLGSLSRITCASAGPWGVSLLGPLPKRPRR